VAEQPSQRRVRPGDDLAVRMMGVVRPGGAMPAVQAPTKAYPRKTTLPLSEGDWRALAEARLRDGTDTAARLRAMIALWREDERLRRSVDERARQLRRWGE